MSLLFYFISNRGIFATFEKERRLKKEGMKAHTAAYILVILPTEIFFYYYYYYYLKTQYLHYNMKYHSHYLQFLLTLLDLQYCTVTNNYTTYSI